VIELECGNIINRKLSHIRLPVPSSDTPVVTIRQVKLD